MIIDVAQLKQRYLKRIAGARDRQAYIGPEVVSLDLTNSCNLSCQYCWGHSPGNPHHFEKARFFPLEKFLEIVGDCVDLNVDQINITAAGEATIHPLFRDMMRHLEQQPLKVKLFTNGTFPLDYCSDVIKGDEVLINFSAVDRQQYRDLQGQDLFDRVVNNLERLVALRNAHKPGFHIELAYIVNTVNIKQIQKMRDLASQLGVNEVCFSRMNVHEYNREIALPEGVMSDLEGEEKRTPSVCLNGWFYLAAKLNGSASTCVRIHQMHLGDLDKGSLKQLWLSKHMMNMRLMGKYGHIQKRFKACQTCPSYDENIQRSQDLAEST